MAEPGADRVREIAAVRAGVHLAMVRRAANTALEPVHSLDYFLNPIEEVLPQLDLRYSHHLARRLDELIGTPPELVLTPPPNFDVKPRDWRVESPGVESPLPAGQRLTPFGSML